MRVTVRYFAAIREAIGARGETRELPEGTSAGQLVDLLVADYPAIDPLRRSSALMINHAYAPPEQTLREGDEVALIPPVSGGGGGGDGAFRVTEESIELAQVEALVADRAAGAVVSFAGTVRDHARGRQVLRLEYEAYPEAAEKVLAQIGQEIAQRWDVTQVAIVHRVGVLQVGEASVAIAVSSAHRAEAFEACRYAIDRIKEIVPIWKKEFYAGGERWIGSEADYQAAFGASGRADRGQGESGPARESGAAGRG
ncbi:MAG TPA: molybdenum cofactor biosynthesis protein MoaE [Thermomicrobiaceae bacterium]|nr:molybdenum cofactor biosynthesis protein MoaE [Thermomicrobiaceae bacterium]